MSSSVFVALLIVATAAIASAGIVSFTDCGKGNVRRVEVDKCQSSPCVLKHGQNIKITAFFVARNNAASVKTHITGLLQGRSLALPDEGGDACASGKISPSCPVRTGQSYKYETVMPISTIIPPRKMMVTYKGVNEKGEVVACANIPMEFKK